MSEWSASYPRLFYLTGIGPRWMGVSQNQSGHFGEEENALPMPQIKLQTIHKIYR